MKEFYSAGNVGGFTYAIHGRDLEAVDAELYFPRDDKPITRKEFASKNAAQKWVWRQISAAVTDFRSKK